MPSLLYVDELFLCGETETLRVIVGRFVEVFRRRGLKVNADKSKLMVLECESRVDGMGLELVSEFN